MGPVRALQFEYGRIGKIENNIHFPLGRGDAVFEHIADDGFGTQADDIIRRLFAKDVEMYGQFGVAGSVVLV